MRWLGDYRVFALLSAAFTVATTILAKMGDAGIPSNLATAIRTAFVSSYRASTHEAARHRSRPT